MKVTTIAAMIIALSMTQTVHAEPAKVAGGKEGGNYARVAANLVDALKDYSEYRGSNTPVILPPTGGSGENLDLLNEGKADVAPVQADVFMYYVRKYPAARSNLEIVGTLPTKECLYLITRKDGDITSADDIEDEKARVVIGNPNSGQNISWQYISSLHKEYAKPETTSKDGDRALNKVETGGEFGFDAYFFTFAANIDNPIMQSVNAPGKNLQFVDFDDSDLNDKLPNGRAVYTFEDVLVKYSGRDREVTVPCTSTLLVINSNIDEKLADRIASIAGKNINRIAGVSNESAQIK